jgi:hypothetical protein
MPTLRLDGDSTGAVKASADAAKSVSKIESAYKSASAEAKKLEAAAKRIVSENETPLERYNRKCADLTKHMTAGRISVEQFSRATSRYRAELDGAGKAQESTFGANAIRNLAGYAAGLFGIQQAIGLVVKGFQEAERLAQSSADNVFAGLDAYGELSAISKDPRDLAFARSLVARGIVPPGQQAQAVGITSSVIKAGFTEQERGTILDIGDTDKVAPGNLAEFALGAKKFQRVFGGDAGSLEDVTNLLMAASRATKQTPGEIANSSARFAKEAVAGGFSDEQALAAYIAIANTSGTPKQAYSRTAKFFKGEETLTPVEQAMMAQQTAALASPGSFRSRGLMETDPILRASDLKEESEGALAGTSESMLAEREALFDAFRAQRRKKFIEQGGGAVMTGIGSLLGGMIDAMGAEDAALRKAMNPEIRQQLTPQLQAGIESYLARIAAATEQTNAKTKPKAGPKGRNE